MIEYDAFEFHVAKVRKVYGGTSGHDRRSPRGSHSGGDGGDGHARLSYMEVGEQRSMYSLESYRFESDGSVQIRAYYKAPAHSAGKLGALFRTYLPEHPEGT